MSEFNPSYKIERQSGISPVAKTATKKPQEPSPSIQADSDRVSLSKASRNPASKNTSSVRQDIVDKYKTMLGKGAYQIKADEIADKMVQKIQENKGPSVY